MTFTPTSASVSTPLLRSVPPEWWERLWVAWSAWLSSRPRIARVLRVVSGVAGWLSLVLGELGRGWDGLPWWGQVLVTAVIVAGLMAFGVGFAAAAATAGVATYIAGHGEGLAALIEDPDRTVAEYVATATPLRVGMDAVDFGLTFIPGSWLGRLPFLPAARRLAGQWAAAAAERVKPLLSRTRVVEPIAVPSLRSPEVGLGWLLRFGRV